MKLKITWQYSLAFLSLLFLLHEAHEIIHTSIGRIICGCWGIRDFNLWALCTGCASDNPISIFSTIAGPFFTYIVLWYGTKLLIKEDLDKKTLGFTLIFASMPFARILTATLNSGDEVNALTKLTNQPILSWVISLIIILLICYIPLKKAYEFINNKYKLLWFLSFLVLPVIFDILVVLVIMNGLLKNGILNEYWILGSPKLVSFWTLSILILTILTYKYINQLTNQNTKK
ncbi:hypothetical protein [Polaribacter porphyrae]|uniref:Uncharacterized protein n=1 Tax=Polaribacter porphyrae TaxID=1137780 RepID=A0A2S7WQV5_9FLAO|nr:hypothetical protein [Polaribacter porphyrae]PQJ80000.1 hypothetical protein BTO18_12835 [Polaribacter porphyrae]